MSDEAGEQNPNTPQGGRGSNRWTRAQVGAFWFVGACFLLFLILIGMSATSDPIQSERFISYGLIVFSASFAVLAFAFLGRQTAKIRFKGLGTGIKIGGAAAAFIIIYGSLQFFVRGTSTLYVELFSDDAFARPWRVQPGQSVPEFAASLKYYSIIAYPEGNNLRLFNLPIFEWVTISARDPRWQVSKLASNDKTCTVEGQRLKGWCSEAKASLQYSQCIEDWRGSGSLPPGSLDDVLKHFVHGLQEVQYPAKPKFSMGDQTRKALAAKVGIVTYNNQDFCTAIYGAKNEIERNLRTTLHIKLGCAYIGISAGSDPVPELPEEQNGWRKSC
jgi:hypothetical protein